MPEEEGGPPDTPDWIVTFTDLMSLLLTFFILLLTFSTPRVENLFELRGSIEAAFGIISGSSEDRESLVPPSEIRLGREQQNPNAPALPPRFLPLEEHDPNQVLYKLRDQTGEQIDFDSIEEGYRVRISDAVRFGPAEEHMDSTSFVKLSKVADALRHVPYHIVIVGYIGNNELKDVITDGIDPMDLAIRRAVHVAERMVRRYDLDMSNIAVAGYGPEIGGRGIGRVELILTDRRVFSLGRDL